MLAFICANSLVFAQKFQMIYLKDKANTNFSTNKPLEFLTQKAIDRRQKQNIKIGYRDLPVNPNYINEIRKLEPNIWYASRWFNAVLIQTDDATLAKINQLSFVQKTERLSSQSLKIEGFEKQILLNKNTNFQRFEEENYGSSFAQISMLGIDKMHNKGYRGEGITIAVIDNGFTNADINPSLKQLKILGTYDFTTRKNNVFNNSVTHGSNVLNILAAYKSGEMIGGAFAANYFLFKTEIDNAENKAEEAFWLAAVERADSLGVDIISTSLGYSDFDDVSMNYKTSDLTGKIALISRAATMCANVGMIVVKSAGNEGNSAWKKITFPADADSILVVGSVDSNGRRALTSSLGPTADGRRKPDVMALGQGTVYCTPSGFVSSGNGTSYATPLITGLVAGVWQAFPNLSNMQIMDYIRRSSNRYFNSNDSIGYGVPNFEKINNLVTSTEKELGSQTIKIYPNPTKNGQFQIDFKPEYVGKSFVIKIYDSSGREWFSKNLHLDKSTQSIDAEKILPSRGWYLLRISGEKGNFTQSLIYE